MTFSIFVALCVEASGRGNQGGYDLSFIWDVATGSKYSSMAKLGGAADLPGHQLGMPAPSNVGGPCGYDGIYNDKDLDCADGLVCVYPAVQTAGQYGHCAKPGDRQAIYWATGQGYSSMAKLGGAVKLGRKPGDSWINDPATGQGYSSTAKLGGAERRRQLVWFSDPATGQEYSSTAKLGHSSADTALGQNCFPTCGGQAFLTDPATGSRYTSTANLGSGRRRAVEEVGFMLSPLGPVPDELTGAVKPICDAWNRTGKLATDTFTCFTNIDEMAQLSRDRVSEGFVEVITVGMQRPGRVTKLQKVGKIYQICHQAAGVGTFNEKHLCHFVDHSFVYQAQAENNGDLKFSIVCHDMSGEERMCHPLRSNDIAFLEL